MIKLKNILKEDSDKAKLYKLYTKAMKMMPGSPAQKKIKKEIDKLRNKLGLNEKTDKYLEVRQRELKKQVKIAIDALNVFSKAINEFINIFVRYHKDAGKAIKDPVFVMINRIINVRGKVNKLVAWKKHLAHLDKKL